MDANALLEEGRVLAAEGPLATVRVERHSSCASCGAGCVCAEPEKGPKIMLVRAVNRVGAREGDRVKIALEPEKLVSMAALAYLMPLVFLFLGAFFGPQITALFGWTLAVDLARALLSLVGLAVGIVLLKLIFLRVKPSGTFTPILIEILDDERPAAPYLDVPRLS